VTGSVSHQNRVMTKVTVTLDEETARWARLEAARRDVSVSSLLRNLLHDHMGSRESYAGAKERNLSRAPRKLGGPEPSREELHDRAGLRSGHALQVMARTTSHRVRLGAQGRLVVPAELREELGLGDGAELAIYSDGRRLILEPPAEVLRRLRRRFAAAGEVSLAELLSAGRDEEARREDEG
jgi:AbrB family looped-hinge helix DNA binding protein